ncbi:hypothetical protein [Alkalihalobacterium sp. APHAB7]|uniref:hypothetical protein n=1 Tax=Alkalihalobacterium sp. APHAB7 TaxID=3402081 RepID=UPI003AB01520
MIWLIVIGIGLLSIIYVALEVATYEDQGKGGRYHLKKFKSALLCAFGFVTVAGLIFYVFFN